MKKIAVLPSTQYGNPVLGGGSEADFALDIGKRLQIHLSGRAEVAIFAVGTNGNSGGAEQAVRWGANLCISLHSDGGYEYSSHHASLMCYQEPRTLQLATQIMSDFCQGIGHTNRGLQKRTPGTNGVAVLRIPEEAGIPAILLEVTWHDRDPDAKLLRTYTWRDQVAQALAKALAKALLLPTPETEEEDDKVVDFEKQPEQEPGQGKFRGKKVDVYQAYGKMSDFLHVRINTGADREYMVFFNKDSEPKGYGPVVEKSLGFRGSVRPLKDVFAESKPSPDDYGWVALHVLPEDSPKLRAFIRP